MKPKYLFLLKFLGFSILLFIFGHQLIYAYAYVMKLGMELLNPDYHVIRVEEFLYGSSMTIIAFIALMFSTPGIPFPKMVVALVIGLISFFLTDWFFIQYIICPMGTTVLNEDSPALTIYVSIKWLLPFVLWIVMSYPYLGKFFGQRQEATAGSGISQ